MDAFGNIGSGSSNSGKYTDDEASAELKATLKGRTRTYYSRTAKKDDCTSGEKKGNELSLKGDGTNSPDDKRITGRAAAPVNSISKWADMVCENSGDDELITFLDSFSTETINSPEANYYGPLLCFVIERSAVRDHLMRIGFCIDTVDNQGCTVLHRTCMGERLEPEKKVECIRWLLASGASIDKLSKSKNTPLMFAVKTLCSGAVELLLNKNANPNIRNAAGKYPLDIIMQEKPYLIYLLLLSDTRGRAEESIVIEKLLLDSGAWVSPGVKEDVGNTEKRLQRNVILVKIPSSTVNGGS